MPKTNIPELIKALAWVEQEASKPAELCEWNQGSWIENPEDVIDYVEETPLKSPDCGTCYCVAGYIASHNLNKGEYLVSGSAFIIDERGVSIWPDENQTIEDRARQVLGLSPEEAEDLFAACNTLKDVRKFVAKQLKKAAK
jgi:hypothetical protein